VLDIVQKIWSLRKLFAPSSIPSWLHAYVEHFFFCRPLIKNTTGKEIFKKVDSFVELNSLQVCLCRWCFRHDENQKGFIILWKQKTKIFR